MKKTWDLWELLAIQYLEKHNYTIKATNFTFSHFWEIDIIAQKWDKTIFVEVKYRSNARYGTAEESISPTKLKKLRKTIEYYCLTNRIDFENIAFDVIAITRQTSSHRLVHYKSQALWK